MTDLEQREAARKFINKWNNKGNEDEDGRSYWIEFLQNILGMADVTDRVTFEKKVKGTDGHTKRIDVYIPETHVLIEQKSLGIALDKSQAGHDGMTPYEQAKYYDNCLGFDEKAKWIITSNFDEIWIYNMHEQQPKPQKVSLLELQDKYKLFDFMVKKDVKQISHEVEVSMQAGDIVGLIYDALLKQYKDPEDPESLKSLNVLCVRIVFCLYAEDAGLFGSHTMFHDYLEQYPAHQMRRALIRLFRVLDQKEEERDPYLADDDPDLAAFPYVNGGLFADEHIEIPSITDEVRDLILIKGSENFDWSQISPTIFGAVFESTLNQETRRSGGMHYTSVENIHKVIDPLFLNDLKAELDDIRNIAVAKTKKNRLLEYQKKLASLTFLDPACGSGNFLTETYLSLRRLENEVLIELQGRQIVLGDVLNPNKVSISQFHGIEINDFAVSVAKTALWIAESQMMQRTEMIVSMHLDFLPLKTNANIVEGNALQIDWSEVVSLSKLNYIIGNQPFLGKKEQSALQKEDLKKLFEGTQVRVGVLDYVAGWFYKASCCISKNPKIKTAFVSTDSLCQGQHVPVLWSELCERCGIEIIFGYRTFKWASESLKKAEVYCVIVGFASKVISKSLKKYIFMGDDYREVDHINPYLVNGPDVWIRPRKNQICGYSSINYGSMPIDNGYLILSPEEYNKINNPDILKHIRPYAGADELLKGHKRYCIWLHDVNRKEFMHSKFFMDRILLCKEFRLNSKRTATQKLAEAPELFGEIRQPESDMLVIPKVSSKHRRYIPILFVRRDEYIINGSSLIIPEGNLLEFGILSSNVHNAWLRAIAETWGHSFQYSTDIYNNFPFPKNISKDIADRITYTASQILSIREAHSDMSIAEMYSPKLGILDDLRKAHWENDRAVMKAYNFDVKSMSEADCVAELMKMYQKLIKDEKKR